MVDNKEIFSDSPKKHISMDGFSMKDNSKKGTEEHKCIHEEDWGITKNTLKNHETRISKGEEVQSDFKEELEKRDNKIYKAFRGVEKSVEALRGDLNLTKEKNGSQDEKIQGINDKEREKIRIEAAAKGQRKGTVYGAIVGAIAGGIITFIFLVALELLKNSPYL